MIAQALALGMKQSEGKLGLFLSKKMPGNKCNGDAAHCRETAESGRGKATQP